MVSSRDTCVSDIDLLVDYDSCISNQLESLAVYDKKLRELLPIFEAQKRIKAALEKFLKKEAMNLRETDDDEDEDGETEDSEDSEESEESEASDDREESVDSDSDGEKLVMVTLIPVGTLLNKIVLSALQARSFMFKLWLRRIELTRKEDTQGYNDSVHDFECAIYNAEEIIKQCRDFIYNHFYDRGP